MTYKVFRRGEYKTKIDTVRTYWKEITFNPSDSFQTYTVPGGITEIKVDCVASRGGNRTMAGGKGGRVQCTLSVTPNEVLYITVGQIPSSGNVAIYNASDIRTNNAGVTDTTSLNSRLIVAGGGGGASQGSTAGSSTYSGTGGAGGGLTGGRGSNVNGSSGYCGSGGTQTAGGAKASQAGSVAGKFGLGGNSSRIHCGDGGAGWYGGGSGGYSEWGTTSAGGGGGGSSYTDSTRCINVIHTQGYQNGAGYITITQQSNQDDYTYYTESYSSYAFNIQEE